MLNAWRVEARRCGRLGRDGEGEGEGKYMKMMMMDGAIMRQRYQRTSLCLFGCSFAYSNTRQ